MATQACCWLASCTSELSPSMPPGRTRGRSCRVELRGSIRTALMRTPWRTSRSHCTSLPSMACRRGSIGAASPLPRLPPPLAPSGAGHSITSRAGLPRLNTLVREPDMGLRFKLGPACWLLRPRAWSWVSWSLRLSKSTLSPPASLPLTAGPDRSSTTRRIGPGVELRTLRSWGLASSRISWLPCWRTSTPRA